MRWSIPYSEAVTDYYRTEWDIARDRTDPRHVYPPPHDVRSLDLGCGCGSPPGVLGADVFGVDIDVEALRLGQEWGAAHRFVAATGEALPFAANTFGRVLARVSLPYMHIDRTLREIARVLWPGGEVWLVLHPPSMAWNEFVRARGASRLLRLYVLVNGTLLHLTGRQLSIARRAETFQTNRAMRRALERAGFRNVRFDRGPHYVVTATFSGEGLSGF